MTAHDVPPGPVVATKNLVLLGAGHAHVEVLRRFARRPPPNARMTLITREPRTLYSGMIAGVLRGEYGRGEAEIDCMALAEAAGARLVIGTATDIDRASRRVLVTGQPAVEYDLLSVDLGGIQDVPVAGGIAVKPIDGLLDRLALLDASASSPARVAVIGAGPAGSELALALALRSRSSSVLLVARGSTILPQAPRKSRRRVADALARAGVQTVLDAEAVGLEDGRLRLRDGRSLAVHAALWATGVVGPAILARSGLACDASGCVRVTATLASVNDPAVFAAGDCARLDATPRPKAGVWAVKAGRPLADSLARACAGRAGREWRPARHGLVILSLAEGRAVAWRGRLAFAGRFAAWLKDRIDQRWIAGV